jgi:hypothetical protein
MLEGDALITCSDCGEPFLYTAGQRKRYISKGYSDPKRCKTCRDRRKAWKKLIGGKGK